MANRRLTVEALERRLLLAGDVSATVKGGWLVVTGDALGNQLEIADLGGGSYQVSGIATKINGVDSGQYVSPVLTKGIKVDLKQGDDDLTIVGNPDFQLTGDLSIQMGDGEDYLKLANAKITGKTTIDLGKGEGVAWIDLVTFEKDVAVKAGDALGVEDPWVSISIERSEVKGNLTVTTGKTNDDVWLAGVNVVKNVSIKTGNGEDYSGVGGWWDEEDEFTPSLVQGSLSIDIGKDGGWMWLADTTVKKDVSFKAGDALGEEFSQGVDVFAATIQGKLTVQLGKGDAEVWLAQATVVKDVSIATGDGNDWIAFEPGYVDGEEDSEFLIANDANNVFGGKVTVNSGRGDDVVAITSADVTGAVSINTGDGYDTVGLFRVVGNSIKSNVSINTGNQSDRIAVVELQTLGNVALNSGNAPVGDDLGGDQVLVTNSIIEKYLNVKTGSGDDWVGIGKSEVIDEALEELFLEFEWDEYGIEADLVEVWGALTVSMGNGWDGLVIGQCEIDGSASIDMGGGSDECEILLTTFGAATSVKMGSGDDYLTIEDSEATGKLTLDGGSGGDDWLDDLGGNIYTQLPTIKGFEF